VQLLTDVIGNRVRFLLGGLARLRHGDVTRSFGAIG
jgi:hypothetical protein